MQLHRFEVEHHHGRIGDPVDKPYGNGVLFWFEIDDFDAAMERVAELRAEIVLAETSKSAGWKWRPESLGVLVAGSRRLHGGAGQSGWIGR